MVPYGVLCSHYLDKSLESNLPRACSRTLKLAEVYDEYDEIDFSLDEPIPELRFVDSFLPPPPEREFETYYEAVQFVMAMPSQLNVQTRTRKPANWKQST